MTCLTWATLVGAMHCGSLSLLVRWWTGLVSLCSMFTGCPEVGDQRPFFWSGSLGAGSSGSSGSPLIQDRSGITAFLKQQLQIRSWVWKSVLKASARACLFTQLHSKSIGLSSKLFPSRSSQHGSCSLQWNPDGDAHALPVPWRCPRACCLTSRTFTSAVQLTLASGTLL